MSDPRARFAHLAVNAAEATAAAGVAAGLAAGGLVVWPVLDGLPTPAVLAAAAFAAGGTARMALEAPRAGRTLRERHRRVHRWIDQRHRARRRRQRTAQQRAASQVVATVAGDTTGGSKRSLRTPGESSSFVSFDEGLKGPKSNETNEDVVTVPAGAGRFPGRISGNSVTARQANGRFAGVGIDETARFWGNVTKTSGEGCWLWTGRPNDDGYGIFKTKTRDGWRPVKAHRWAYTQVNGPTPLDLDHVCHTNDPSCAGGPTCPHRACVRPDHLEPVTQQENDRRARTRRQQIDHEQEHQP